MIKKAQVVRIAALYRKRLVSQLRLAYRQERSPVARQALRLAVLWVQADSISALGAAIPIYDLIVRVETLVGAVGMSDGQARKMINRPMAALKKLKQEMPPGSKVNPKWFQKGETGMFRIMWSRASRVLHSQEGVTGRSTSDIITDLIMGLAKKGGTRKMPIVSAGKAAGPRIFSGADSPENVGAGIAGKAMSDAAKTEGRTRSRREQIDRDRAEMSDVETVYEEDGVVDVAEEIDQDSMARVALKAMMNPTDPVGAKILMIGRTVAKQNTKSGKYAGWGPLLDSWLNTVGAGDPNWAEAARLIGKQPAGINREVKKAFKVMWQAVAADKDLMHEISTRWSYQSGVGRYASKKEAVLRRKLIRLARQRPDLRSFLLPLLQQG